MFLEELKTWLRNQLTSDIVQVDELMKRDVYISKLKHDNYYWYINYYIIYHKYNTIHII